MLDPFEKMKVARRYLFTRKPFFGSLLAEIDSKQGCIPDPTVKTFQTNGNWIKWNPAFVKNLTVDQIVGVLAHELLHVGLGHTLRRGRRSMHLWQTATDWAINDVLVKDGFKLPDGVLYPPHEQKGKSAESNHDHLARLYDDKPPSQPGNQQESDEDKDENDPNEDENEEDSGSDGDGEMDDGFESSKDPSPDNEDGEQDSDGDGDPDGNAQNDAGGDGDGSPDPEDSQDESDDPDAASDDDGAVDGSDDTDDGGSGDDEDEDSGGGSGKPKLPEPEWGEVEDEPGADGKPMDDVTREKAIRERAIQLVEAMRAAGNGSPEALRRLVNEVIEGKADWRQILRQFCNETMKTDTSWRVPNRRFIGQDIYLPGEDGEGLGEQVVVLDVSGSITDRDLKRFQREMRKQFRELPPTKLHVIWHDDSILEHVVCEGDYENLDLSGPGGGGTNFVCVTEYLRKQHIHPKCIVWFTDLETSRWPEDPMIPTLWVVWPCRWGTQVSTAPWGMVNLMPQEDDA